MEFTAGRNTFDASKYLSTPEYRLETPVLFSIIHIHNITRSRLDQLDQWRQTADPNAVGADRVRNRPKVITEVNMDDDGVRAPKATGLYKLTLRDNFNNYCTAYEHEHLPFLHQGTSNTPLPIPLGGKIIANKGTVVMNGVLMLKLVSCQYLGVDESSDLYASLNSNVVNKYIDVLSEELKNQPEKA